ncbi:MULTISPECIES: hypothetical protein [unclassified Leeuwenhoekiella]|nr:MULTISPECIES: hypothetical protein [unclassified Leeuwenhoekiella]
MLVCFAFAEAQTAKISLNRSISLNPKAEVVGQLLVNGKSSVEIRLNEGNVVDLFKNFKTGKHQIQFNFKGAGLAKDQEGRGVALFTFVTEIYKDGKLMRSVKREPLTFFPGEMLEPVEAFDVIPLLTFAQGNPLENGAYPGKLTKGKYLIKIKAIPMGSSGKIEEANLIVWI